MNLDLAIRLVIVRVQVQVRINDQVTEECNEECRYQDYKCRVTSSCNRDES